MARTLLMLACLTAAVLGGNRTTDTCACVGSVESATCEGGPSTSGNNTTTLDALPVANLRRLTIIECDVGLDPFLALTGLLSLTVRRNAVRDLGPSLRRLPPSLRTLALIGVGDSLGAGWLSGPSSLQTLDLSGNHLADIRPGVLANLDTLTSLILARNCYTRVEPSWFSDLRHLQILDLSSNNISLINGTFQTSLPFLQHLDLSENQLSSLSQLTASALTVLDLSSNHLSRIREGVFSEAANLQRLNLSRNDLSTLTSGMFAGLGALQRLDLSWNDVRSLPDAVFSPLVSLLNLNLTNNALTVLSESCLSGLIHLQSLDVSGNRISAVSPGSFQPLVSLIELLLADNPLRDLLMVVGAGGRLTTVQASRARLTQIPATLTRSVRALRLAGNLVLGVRCGDLDSYPLLQLLDLTGNMISEVEEDALGRLELLSVLLLSGNRLNAVPRSLPGGLTVLSLQDNPITTVAPGDLQGLYKLRELSLRRCQLTTIQDNSLDQLPALEALDLSENPIKFLRSNDLSGPLKLRVLRLSYLRDLESPGAGEELLFPVNSPEYLEVLELDRSPVLAKELLADTAALAAFRELQELKLDQTNLATLRSDLFHFLPRLRLLGLSGNPWNCEDLAWLGEWIRLNRQESPGSVQQPTCAEPQHLLTVPLSELREEVTTVGQEPRYESKTYWSGTSADPVPLHDDGGTESMPQAVSISETLHPTSTSYTPTMTEFTVQERYLDSTVLSSPKPTLQLDKPSKTLYLDNKTVGHHVYINKQLKSSSHSPPFKIFILPKEQISSSNHSVPMIPHDKQIKDMASPSKIKQVLINISENFTQFSQLSKFAKQDLLKSDLNKGISHVEQRNVSFNGDNLYNHNYNEVLLNDSEQFISEITSKLDNPRARPHVFLDTGQSAVNESIFKIQNQSKQINNTEQTRHSITDLTRSTINQTIKDDHFTGKTPENVSKTTEGTAKKHITKTSQTFNISEKVYLYNRSHENFIVLRNGESHRTSDISFKGIVREKINPPLPWRKEQLKPTHPKETDERLLHVMQKDEPISNIQQHIDIKGVELHTHSYNATGVSKTLMSKVQLGYRNQSIYKPTEETLTRRTPIIEHLKLLRNTTQNTTRLMTQTPTRLMTQTPEHNLSTTSSNLIRFKNSTFIQYSSEEIILDNMNTSVTSNIKSDNSEPELSQSPTLIERAPMMLGNINKSHTKNRENNKPVIFSNGAFSSAGTDGLPVSKFSGSHPGMFVLLGVGLCMAVALAMTLSHCAKRRRRLAMEYSRQQDIEVRSLSSIGDIW